MAVLNKKFYKGTDLYSDGDIEKEILSMVASGKPLDEIVYDDDRWAVYYHLTSVRRNILEWYPFKNRANVLEIGAGCGAITGLLTEKCERVVSMELSSQRAEIIAARYPDAENLEIIVGNFEDIEIDEKFDYVTLIGVLEYAGSFISGSNPYKSFLEKIRKYLKPDGVLLIAIENRLGLKYLAGAGEDHTGIMMEGPEGYAGNENVKTFGKKQLSELVTESGFEKSYFYFPHPDYKLPAEVFSENYLPNEFAMLQAAPNFDRPRLVTMDETLVYESIISNGLYGDFANSFLLECGNIDAGKVMFAKYNRERKSSFCLETKIYENYVTKRSIGKDSLQHLKNLRENHIKLSSSVLNPEFVECTVPEIVDENTLKFDKLNGESVSKILLRKYSARDRDGFLDIIKRYAEIIFKGYACSDKLHISEGESWLFDGVDIETINASPPFMSLSCVDLVFSNVYMNDGNIELIDQEWLLESRLPLKFAIFRAVYYFYRSDYAKLDLDSFVAMEDVLTMLNISSKEAENFVKLDSNFQAFVIDDRYITALKRYDQRSYDIKKIITALEMIYTGDKWAQFNTKKFTIGDDLAAVMSKYAYLTENDDSPCDGLSELMESNEKILLDNIHLSSEVDKLTKRAHELHDDQKELLEIINTHRQEILVLGDKVNAQAAEINAQAAEISALAAEITVQAAEINAQADEMHALEYKVLKYNDFLRIESFDDIQKEHIRIYRVPHAFWLIATKIKKILSIFKR